MTSPDPLQRFLDVQETMYELALQELRNGRKCSHWMWYIFPQLAGLGHSIMACRYAICDLSEVKLYLAHPVLGPRLLLCCEALLSHCGRSATEILGHPDDIKLRSSMTLFAEASEEIDIFKKVLDQYFAGQADIRTLDLLKK